MKKLLFLLLLIFIISPAQPIWYAEYFIDSDPGLGNGTGIQFTPGMDVTLDFTADVSNFDEGMHVLHVRAKDYVGRWGLTYYQPFLVESFYFSKEKTIRKMEYFYDEDPGIGGGTQITAAQTSDVEYSFIADISSLEEGLHVLHLRVQDEFGRWSIPYYQPFLVESIYLTREKTVDKVAYYFTDSDSTYTEFFYTSFTPTSDGEISFAADLSELEELHNYQIHVYAVDEKGKKSFIYSHAFQVDVGNFPPMFVGLPDFQFDEDDSTSVKLNKYVSDFDHDTTELVCTAEVVLKNSGQSGDDLLIDIADGNIAKLMAEPDSCGIYRVAFTVTDPKGKSDTDTVTVTVNPIEDDPVVISPVGNFVLQEDFEKFIIANPKIIFNDPDPGDSLTFTVSNDNSKISAGLDNGNIYLEADADYFGEGKVTIKAKDQTNRQISDICEVTILSINDKPVLSGIPGIEMDEHDSSFVALNKYLTDVDHDSNEVNFTAKVSSADLSEKAIESLKKRAKKNGLTFSSDPADLKVTINQITHIAVVKPAQYKYGVWNIEFTATDDSAAYDRDTTQVLVNMVNDPPFPFAVKSPANNLTFKTTDQITLSWENNGDPDEGDEVEFIFYIDFPGPGGEKFELGQETSYTIDFELADNSIYYWKIVARDLLGLTTDNTDGFQKFIINDENEHPNVFMLVTPTAQSVEITQNPKFYWEAATDPDPEEEINYELFVDPDSTFSSTEGISSDTNSISAISEGLIDNSFYFWYVKASDDEGLSVNSDTIKFAVNTVLEPPDGFDLLAPKHEQELFSDTVNFVWSAAFDNDPNDYAKYIITISDDSLFSNLLFEREVGVDTNYLSLGELEKNKKYWWFVEAIDTDSLITGSETFSFEIGSVVKIEENEILPQEYSLKQNYPNPFNPVTTISYDLPRDSDVTLTIYDIAGRMIETLVDQKQNGGRYTVQWDASSKSSGVYFYKISTGEFQQVRKCLLVK